MAAFRPEIWATMFKQYFAAQPACLDYIERYDGLVGTGTRGDTIKIPSLTLPASIAITPGSVGTTQSPTDGTVAIVLDKFRGHPVPVTPLDEQLNHPDYADALMREAARRIKQDTNELFLDLVDDVAVTQAANSSAGGALTDATILEAGRLLDEAEFPEEDRFIAVTSEAYKDIMALDTFISRDYGDGQNQRRIEFIRSFQVIRLPQGRFNSTTGVDRMMAWHRSAIGAAVANPHLKLADDAGEFRRILEVGAIWGQKILSATGIVKIYR